jgi:hypothetical protein
MSPTGKGLASTLTLLSVFLKTRKEPTRSGLSVALSARTQPGGWYPRMQTEQETEIQKKAA